MLTTGQVQLSISWKGNPPGPYGFTTMGKSRKKGTNYCDSHFFSFWHWPLSQHEVQLPQTYLPSVTCRWFSCFLQKYTQLTPWTKQQEFHCFPSSFKMVYTFKIYYTRCNLIYFPPPTFLLYHNLKIAKMPASKKAFLWPVSKTHPDTTQISTSLLKSRSLIYNCWLQTWRHHPCDHTLIAKGSECPTAGTHCCITRWGEHPYIHNGVLWQKNSRRSSATSENHFFPLCLVPFCKLKVGHFSLCTKRLKTSFTGCPHIDSLSVYREMRLYGGKNKAYLEPNEMQ